MAEENQMLDDIILKAVNIKKIYPGTTALDNVNFNIYKGKVNVLIGENGAGKSTLMKIIAGVEQPTSGELLLEGEKVHLSNTKTANEKGIGIIYQELNLFPMLTVAQNIFMAKEKNRGGVMLDNKAHYRIAKEVMERLEHPIDPETMVAELKVGQQQIVEIAKTMVQQDLKILIMDEPTSSLSNSEVEILFKLINELKNQGIAIVYISHRLEEIMRIGDHVTILRDGKFVAEDEVKNVDVPWIVRNMVGKDTQASYIDPNKKIGEEIFAVEGITLPKYGGGYLVNNVSFSLKAGEVLGFYGLMGAGRTEMVECIMGLHEEAEGYIKIDGKKIKPRNVINQIRNGLGHIPEDRQREGLIQTMSIEQNMTLSSISQHTTAKVINDKKALTQVKEMIKRLYIKVADPKFSIMSLSGGNQQKVVIGKWILNNPKVLFMDEPTRGIDVGAKEDVFRIMDDLAKRGIGVIFVGSDIKEIMSVCDRILVMSNGMITGEFEKDEINDQNLVKASAAGYKE